MIYVKIAFNKYLRYNLIVLLFTKNTKLYEMNYE